VVLLKNMLRAGQLLDDTERQEARLILPCPSYPSNGKNKTLEKENLSELQPLRRQGPYCKF
jgi:hypothetical protein